MATLAKILHLLSQFFAFFRKRDVKKIEKSSRGFLLQIQDRVTGQEQSEWIPIWVRFSRIRQRIILEGVLQGQTILTKSPTPTNLRGDLKAILLGVPPLEDCFPEEIIEAHRAKVGGKCQMCGWEPFGKWDLEGHHKVLRSLHGQHTPENILLLCISCHYRLHIRHKRFWIARGAPNLMKDRFKKFEAAKKRQKKRKKRRR